MAQKKTVSTKRYFVQDGVFNAEVNEFFSRVLSEEGYGGAEIRKYAMKTEIVLNVSKTREVLGTEGKRLRELTLMMQKRFNLPPKSVNILLERIEPRQLCAMVQAEALKYRLLRGVALRRACYGILRIVMDFSAVGCEIVISGKLRAQRAKSVKFKGGFLISSGNPKTTYVETAVRSVRMKQGMLGIKVSIMRPYDDTGRRGPATPLPDCVKVKEPKPDIPIDSIQKHNRQLFEKRKPYFQRSKEYTNRI